MHPRKNKPTRVSFREDEEEARSPSRAIKWDVPELRHTKVTFLPTCARCRRYPARLINGVWDCGGPH